MGEPGSIDAYTRSVWAAVALLWPNLGADPAGTVEPEIPVLPVFLAEAHGEDRSPESAALEVLRFFLRLYIENGMSPEARKEHLEDLDALSKRSFEESQRVDVLPMTAALVHAHATVAGWADAGKVPAGASQALNGEIVSALLGRPGRRCPAWAGSPSRRPARGESMPTSGWRGPGGGLRDPGAEVLR